VAAAHSFFFARTAQYLLHLKLEAPWIDRIFGVGGGPMTIGQISEVVVLALMPLVVTRVPRKALLTVGLLAYVARFFVFAYLPHPWAIYPGLALHGVVFGCFFFLCFMVIDEQTTPAVRSSAQNLFNLIVFGVGVIIGNLLAGWIADWTRTPGGDIDWRAYYAIPGWITLACAAALLAFYPRRSPAATPHGLAAA
jgi:MFS family permease